MKKFQKFCYWIADQFRPWHDNGLLAGGEAQPFPAREDVAFGTACHQLRNGLRHLRSDWVTVRPARRANLATARTPLDGGPIAGVRNGRAPAKPGHSCRRRRRRTARGTAVRVLSLRGRE